MTDTKNDSVQKHINDTLVAGGFRNDRKAVEILTTEGPSDVMNLAKLGVDFDLNENGTPNLTLEGGTPVRAFSIIRTALAKPLWMHCS